MADEQTDQKDFTKADFIEEADRLQMENFHLKIQNLELQKQVAEQTIDSIENMGRTLRAQATTFRAKLDAKYGMPITPASIDKTGRLVRPQPKSLAEIPTPNTGN